MGTAAQINSGKDSPTDWLILQQKGPPHYANGDPPRGRTENLLIKSKLLSVHRRALQSTVSTILRLKAKTVPTGQK